MMIMIGMKIVPQLSLIRLAGEGLMMRMRMMKMVINGEK